MIRRLNEAQHPSIPCTEWLLTLLFLKAKKSITNEPLNNSKSNRKENVRARSCSISTNGESSINYIAKNNKAFCKFLYQLFIPNWRFVSGTEIIQYTVLFVIIVHNREEKMNYIKTFSNYHHPSRRPHFYHNPQSSGAHCLLQ